jgi:hypothetical protein
MPAAAPKTFLPSDGDDSSGRWEPVTPDDDKDLGLPRAVWVGSGGDLVAIAIGGSDPRTFLNVSDGTLLPIRPQRIMAATTASNILVLY